MLEGKQAWLHAHMATMLVKVLDKTPVRFRTSFRTCCRTGFGDRASDRVWVSDTYHDSREVDGGHAIEDEEKRSVGEGQEACNDASRHEENQDMEVGEIGGPGWGLMLRDRGDDGNELGCVGGI